MLKSFWDTYGATILTALATTAASLIASLKLGGRKYLESKAEAAGRLGAEKELANHQGALDAELERVKAQHALKAEVVRAGLQRKATAYAIYVEKRIAAVTTMMATFIQAETNSFQKPPLIELAAGVEHYQQKYANQISAETARVSQAYRDAALYLSPALAEEVKATREAFAAFARSQLAKVGEGDIERHKANPALQHAMVSLTETAQRELRDSGVHDNIPELSDS